TTGGLTITGPGTAEVSPTDSTVYVAQVANVSTFCGLYRMACPTSVVFNVNVFPSILPNMSATDVICADDGTATAAPTGGSGSYNFTWSTGAVANCVASSTITNQPAGV